MSSEVCAHAHPSASNQKQALIGLRGMLGLRWRSHGGVSSALRCGCASIQR
jgi:hypothetical protein